LPPDHGEPAKGNEGFVPLPVDLRKALLKALEEGDLDGLCGLIERDVAAIDPARGQSLREMAVNYDYVNLRRALKAGLNS
jgi:hypothetical protein